MKIGIIGGSGLYEMAGLTRLEEHALATPFGAPSDVYISGVLHGREVVFLPRHGTGHRLLPSEIPFRANVWGMKKLGVTHLLSVSAVGSLKEEIAPGHIVFPHQFIDRTFLRESMDKDPNYERNLARLADRFMARGQFGLAAQYYGQLLEDTRYARAAYQNVALCYLNLGRPQEAVAALEEYLKHNYRDADAYHLLGEAKRRLGLVADARHAFQTALRLKPDHTAASQALRDMSPTTPSP